MNKKPTRIIIGEDRKIDISLLNLPDGVTMETVDVTFTVSAGHHSVEFTRDQIKKTADGKYYLALATEGFPPGDLMLSAHVRIADDDFADGYRDEFPEFDLNAKLVQR